MGVKLLTEHHFEFLSLKGGCAGLSESTHVKMPHCWKSHFAAQMFMTTPRYVEGSDLLCCGKFMYNHYRDCKDTNFFLCGDEVSDIICLPSNEVPDITPVL